MQAAVRAPLRFTAATLLHGGTLYLLVRMYGQVGVLTFLNLLNTKHQEIPM
jgi:hypothetical protein